MFQKYLENTIKTLGEKYGYGNIMDIASKLWQDNLVKKNLPSYGAFVPVILYENEDGEKLCFTNNHTYSMIELLNSY